jgi:hypothetical protein
MKTEDIDNLYGLQMTPQSSWYGALQHQQTKAFTTNDYDAFIENANKAMQEKYPGNYIVEERFDPVRQQFALFLKFDTPEDETLFILKYE